MKGGTSVNKEFMDSLEVVIDDTEVMFDDLQDVEEIVTPSFGTGCTCAETR